MALLVFLLLGLMLGCAPTEQAPLCEALLRCEAYRDEIRAGGGDEERGKQAWEDLLSTVGPDGECWRAEDTLRTACADACARSLCPRLPPTSEQCAPVLSAVDESVANQCANGVGP